MTATSIHHQRRWYYVLWGTLLLASLVALGLWERPGSRDQGTLYLVLHVTGAPAGTQVQTWAGPSGSWKGPESVRWEGILPLPLSATGDASPPPLHLAVARRRWGSGTIPRGTWDLVVVRFLPAQGPARYLLVSCASDIQDGLVRRGRRLSYEIGVAWTNLQVDAGAPLRVP